MGDKRLSFAENFARNIARYNLAFLNWPNRFASGAIECVKPALLGGLHDSRDGFTVDLNIEQLGSVRVVKIPNVVVNHLEVPDPPTCFRIQRDEAGTKEVTARAVAAVIVIGWRVCWDIDQAQVRVCRQWRPSRDVTRVSIGICLPGVVPKLTFLREDVEPPKQAPVFASYPRTWPGIFFFCSGNNRGHGNYRRR